VKKVIALTVVSLILISLFSVAFAADEIPAWLSDKLDQQKARIEEAVEDGKITSEQAEQCLTRLEERSKFALVFASEEVPGWFYDKVNWEKDKIGQAVENGTITSEQAQDYIDRIETRVKDVEENGFGGFGHDPGFGMKGFRGKGEFGRGGRAGMCGFGRMAPAE